MSNQGRGKRFFANRMHRDLFLTVSAAAFFPAAFTAVALFYLIFQITADQIVFPEAIASTLIPAARQVAIILLIGLPVALIIILVFAWKLAHRMVGPYDRIVRELGENLNGSRTGPIIIRKSDRFLPLVEKINALLARHYKG